MFFFSFLFLSRADEGVHLYGNWEDSYLVDETLMFFEFIRPDLTNFAQQVLQDGDFLTKEEILNRLNVENMPKFILGLLNLSLTWRYFHPRASAGRKIPKTQAEMRGFAVSVPNNFTKFEIKNFTAKFLSHLYSFSTSEERYDFMRSVTQDFPKFVQTLENQQIFDDLYDLVKNVYKEQKIASSINVNGRIVDGTPQDALRALLEETQTRYVLGRLGYVNGTDYENLIYYPNVVDVHNYVEPPAWHRDLTHHDYYNVLARSPKELNNNTYAPEEFMRYKEALSSLQLFVNINNPSSRYILHEIMEIARSETPYSFSVYCIGDLTNETQKKIIYSYVRTEETLGARTAVKYLFDSLEHFNFKKEYKATRPTTSWKDLETLYNDTRFSQIINELDEYYKQKGINDTTYSVNGVFAKGELKYLETRRFYLKQINRLMDANKAGKFVTNMSYIEFLKNDSIIIDTMQPAVEVNDNQIISFANLDARIIYQIFDSLFNRASYRHQKETFPIPVFYVDCKPSISISSIKEDIPNFEFYELKSDELDAEVRLLLNIGDGPKTIVGPHVFNSNLNIAELDYALRYVHKRYCHNISVEATSPQVLFITINRATQNLHGIKRINVPEVNTTTHIIDYASDDCEIRYNIFYNPLSYNFRQIIDVAYHISRSGAAVSWFIPVIDVEAQKDVILPWMQETFYPIYDDYNSFAPASINMSFHGPNSWAVIKKGKDYYMDGFLVVGYCPGADKIQTNYETKKVIENGYFQLILPPGIYDAKGVDRAIIVDCYLPAFRMYRASHEQIDAKIIDNETVIFSIITAQTFEKNFMLMLSSLVNHTKEQVTCYIVNPPREGTFFGVNMKVIPRWTPPFAQILDDNQYVQNFKHSLVDMILPCNYKTVTFVDQSIFFVKDVMPLVHFNMDKAVIAAPHIGKRYKKYASMWFMERESMLARAGRPFHASRLFVINMQSAFDQKYFEYARYLSRSRFAVPIFINNMDDDLMNHLQVPCQFITLPEEVSYYHGQSLAKTKEKALSEFAYDTITESAVFNSIKKFNKLREGIYKLYLYHH